MKKKPRNNRKKWKYGLILSGLLACSTFVYGFDISDDPDIGGFDMDIGEGTGEIPENWEDPENSDEEGDPGEGNATDEGDFDQDFVTDSGRIEDDLPKEQRWEEEIPGGESAATVRIDENERDESKGNEEQENRISDTQERVIPTIAVSVAPVLTPTPEPTVTPTPVMTKIPTVKPQKTERTSPKISDIPKAPAKKKQEHLKESEPLIRVEITENQLLLRIDGAEPFQILSFRINGKECKWSWKGPQIVAEFSDEKEKPQKAELLGFVKSGRLYHEIVDLTEKQ